MTATLYIVGTGPGDPELLTLKAINTAKSCPVIISPRGSKSGQSTALAIIRPKVPLDTKRVLELHFPMKKIHSNAEPDPEVLSAWNYAAETVLSYLAKGQDVCFPTLGDPAIYSTGYYLYETICDIRPDVNVVFIPGIPAMSSCSATLGAPICLGDEMVAIIPATFPENHLKEVLLLFDTIVLMKVHRVMEGLLNILGDCELLDKAVLVERAGTKEEKIVRLSEKQACKPHYFSTIVVRKRKEMARSLAN